MNEFMLAARAQNACARARGYVSEDVYRAMVRGVIASWLAETPLSEDVNPNARTAIAAIRIAEEIWSREVPL
jgi:hypothetical protein